MIIGVENRVEELADRPFGYKLHNAPSFTKLIPLSEIISGVIGKAVATKSVWETYYKLVGKLGSEYDILRKTSYEELLKHIGKEIAEAIIKSREQKIRVIPGYDGVYGVPVFDETKPIVMPRIDDDDIDTETKEKAKQKGLQDYF